MKVLGQLEKAQLENLTADPAPASIGQVYMNTLNVSAPKPRIYTAAGWRDLQMGQTSATIVQNSGKAVTVNWANGLNQQVNLTDNAVISFSNPVEGSIHTLLVVQNSSAVYLYTLNMADQDVGVSRSAYQPYLPMAKGTDRTHSWFYKSGERAAVTTIPVPGPTLTTASLISGAAYLCAVFSPDGKWVEKSRGTTPYNDKYNNIECDIQANMPVNYAVANGTLAANALGVAVPPQYNTVFYAVQASPFIQGISIRPDSAAPVSSYANPGTLPAGNAWCVAISPRGDYVGVGHTTTPFMSFYPNDGQAFGAKLTNPGTLPAATPFGMAFSPQGDYLAAVGTTSPYLQVWPFSMAGAFGTIVANPSVLPAGGPSLFGIGKSVAWRPQGDYIAMALGGTSPGYYVVPFDRSSGTFGTAITVSGSAIAPGGCTSVAWTPDGQYLLVGCQSSPYLLVYDFSNFTLGAPVSYAGSNPGAQINDIAVHPSGDYCYVMTNATPFVKIVPLPTKARSYIKLI